MKDAKTLPQLYKLWDQLTDVPVNQNDELECTFYHFEKCTSRYDVWRWFEQQNCKFVVGDVQYGIRAM